MAAQRRIPRIVAAALCVAALLSAQAAEHARSLSDEEWSADLDQLAASIRDIHFKPFHVLLEEEFDAAVEQLHEDIAGLSEPAIMIRMAQIVAALEDGHTRLQLPRLYQDLALRSELGHGGTPPPEHDALKLGLSPLRYGLFSDGLFIVGALPRYRELIGQRVLLFDDTPVEEAIERVRSVSFVENDSRAKLMAPDRLALPDVLQVLGIAASRDIVRLTTVDGEGRETQTGLQTVDEPGLAFASGAPTPPPLWQSRRDDYRWYRILNDRDAIYVQINEFEEEPVTPYGDFVAEIVGAARGGGVSRFVIDLRNNSGGIGAWVTPFVTGLAGSEFNEYGRLYVLMGRETFSAAEHFLHRFEEYTYAIFVGEPSGAKPSHFGDSRRIRLENSGLTLRVSTIYWHSWLANDFRDAINPHLAAPIASADYFAGIDPGLEAALNYDVPQSLARQIEEQFRLGNNQNALLLYQRYMSDASVPDHREAIPGLLEMADRLVEDGLIRPGYFVYFLANRTYPGDDAVEAGLARIEPLLE